MSVARTSHKWKEKTMNEYIKKNEVKVLFDDFYTALYNFNDWEMVYNCVMEIINNTPAIEIPQWTLCSEALPNENGWYLIALEYEWGVEYEMGEWKDGMWWNNNSHVNVAWMPLPKLYN